MGVTILEMYRGEIVFKGKTNNEILWETINLFGGFHPKTLKQCRRTDWFSINTGAEGTVVQYLKHLKASDKHILGTDMIAKAGTISITHGRNGDYNHGGVHDVRVAEYAEWFDAPCIHSHLREVLFQLPTSLLHKVTNRSFDSFILNTLKVDPSKRISSRDALKSTFLTND